MSNAAYGNIFLHVAGLGLAGSHGNVGTGGKLAHEDAVAVATDIGDGVEDAVYTHADADFVAEVLDVDVASAELVGLVDKEVEDFFGGNGI